jgi:hypothetical protein
MATHTSPANCNTHEQHELGRSADRHEMADMLCVCILHSAPLTILANQTHSKGDVVRGGVRGDSNEWERRRVRTVELKAPPST